MHTSNFQDFLKMPDKYNSLYLSNCSLWKVDLEQFINILKKNETLTELQISNVTIDEEDFKKICNALTYNIFITKLTISNNIITINYDNKSKNINKAEIVKISSMHTCVPVGILISYNQTITELSLENNSIEDSGAKSIAFALRGNNTIKKLNLSNNKIGDGGAEAFYKLIEGEEIIVKKATVNEKKDEIKKAEDKEPKEILPRFEGVKTLDEINFDANQIGSTGIEFIKKIKVKNISYDHQQLNGRIDEFTIAKSKPIIDNIIPIIFPKDEIKVKEEVLVDKEVKDEANTGKEIVKIFDKNIVSQINQLMFVGNDIIQHYKYGIFLFGPIGSGKSTIAHILTQGEVEAKYDDNYGIRYIDTKQPLENNNIDHNKNHATKLIEKSELDDLVIWDLPGFRTQDVVQEIATNFYLNRLCTITDQLKFILVIPDAMISCSKGIYFIEYIKQLAQNFSNINIFDQSLALIVTQAPSTKKPEHIINCVKTIIEHNDQIDGATKQLIEYLLKSVHLLHTPDENGLFQPQTDILAAINNTIKYCDNDQITTGMALSEDAQEYCTHLLQITSESFTKILQVVVTAIANINPLKKQEKSDEKNAELNQKKEPEIKNDFIENYHLIKDYVPPSLQYRQIEAKKISEFFPLLSFTKTLQDIFFNTGDNIATFKEGLIVIKDVLETFEKFKAQNDENFSHKLQEYAFVLEQQFESINFYYKTCKKELPSLNDLANVIKHCRSVINSSFEQLIREIKFDPHNPSLEYYNEIIENIGTHSKSRECTKLKIDAHLHLAKVAMENHNIREAILHNMSINEIQRDFDSNFAVNNDELVQKMGGMLDEINEV